MVSVFEDDTEEYSIVKIDNIGLDSDESSVMMVTDNFLVNPENLKKHAGLSLSMKRKIGRMEKVFEGSGASSKQTTVKLTAYDAYDVVEPPYNQDYLAQLYEKNSTHYAAVNAKVYNTVALGYDWMPTAKATQKLDDAEGSQEKVDKVRRSMSRMKKGLDEWLDSLNMEDSFTETLIKMWKDYETTGNGYLEVGRTATGQIGYIGHIPSVTMRVRRLRDGFVQMVENRSVFFRNFEDFETPNPLGDDPNPNEIIHFKNYSPTGTFYGIPDVIPALAAVAGSGFAAAYNIDYFEHKAVPRHLVIIKGAQLSPRAEQKVYEFFEQKLKGKNHRTAIIPIPADSADKKVDIEIKAIEAGVQEGSFIKYSDFNRDQILAAHRVPITKVMVAPGMALATSRDADKGFKEQVTRPMQKIIERRLNAIMSEVTDVFFLKLNELTLTDEDTTSKIDERDLRYGVLLPNERRIKLGLPPRDGGDEPWVAKPQDSAEMTAQTTKSRARDSARSAGATDSAGEGRASKGEGRTVE